MIETLSAIPQAQLDDLIFRIVNVYGTYQISDLVPTCSLHVTRIEEHDGDCGPIPNRATTWGAVKATYR